MLTTVEKVIALKNVELFKDIPGEVLADIAFLLDEVNYEEGSYVVYEGELGKELFVIVEGQVDVVVGGKPVNRLFAGQYFGEMAIIDSQPRSASIVARNEIILLKIDKDDFYEILQQRNEVAIGIIKVLSDRIRNCNKALFDTQLK